MVVLLRGLLGLIWQEGREHVLDDPGGDEEHDEDGGAEHDEAGAEAAEVAPDREVDHLLDRVEVGVVQVAQKPGMAQNIILDTTSRN